jgi:hypothetical protein
MLRFSISNLRHGDFAMMDRISPARAIVACLRCLAHTHPRLRQHQEPRNIHDPRAKQQGKIMNFFDGQWPQTRRHIRPPRR